MHIAHSAVTLALRALACDYKFYGSRIRLIMYCHQLSWMLVLLIRLFSCVSAQYEDVRCRCTCLPYPKHNYNAEIYTKNVSHSHCNCLEVVLSKDFQAKIPEVDWEPYCLRCECKYEVRSTKTLQVVVCLFVTLIGLLTLYMIFMLIADPILNKWKNKGGDMQPLVDDETEMSSLTRTTNLSHSAVEERTGSSVFQRVNLVQSRWKKQVKEQRSSVFERQEMLQ
ncbi:unnamed protein product [Clavelina lepadiformis]|uniref:Transmembrane protein 9 n=1 Tax=Clavelina lepadiformis TaxID=159417 RepID=A0ABP0G608_CLALP